MFATISGTVYAPVHGIKDRFGNPQRAFDGGTAVDGLLVAPGSTEDLDASRPDGVSVALTVHFPKTWATSLRGCEIDLAEPYSGRYRVIGDPQPYMDANTPTTWHLPVEVERADG